MTLTDLINELIRLEYGNGDLKVFATDTSSSVETPVSSVRIHEVVESDFLADSDELAVGTRYVSIAIGH